MPFMIDEDLDPLLPQQDNTGEEDDEAEDSEIPMDVWPSVTADMNEEPEERSFQNLLPGLSSTSNLGENYGMRARRDISRNGIGVLSSFPEQSNDNQLVFYGDQPSFGEFIYSSYSGNHPLSISSSPSSISNFQVPRESKSRHFIPYDIRNYIISLYEEYVIQYPKATIIEISKAIYEHYIKHLET